jgi:hypothetical protein
MNMKKTFAAILLAVPLLALGAGGKANTMSNAVFNTFFRTTAYGAPANVYPGLLSVCPTAGTVGTELTIGTNGYARASAIAKGDASWTYTAATWVGPSQISNTAAIVFPTVATASWTVNCVGVYSASTGGVLLYWAPITGAPVTISVGAHAEFAADTLVLTEN